MITNPVLTNPNSQTEPFSYTTSVVQTVLSIFYIVGVIYFVWHFFMAGFHWISAEGDPKKIETARDEMKYGIVGLVIVFITMAILKLAGRVLGITSLENLFLTWPTL